MRRRRLPALSADEVVRALERAGFRVHRIKGSHHHLRHPDRSRARSMHRGDLPPGTLQAIIKQAGLSRDEFLDLL